MYSSVQFFGMASFLFIELGCTLGSNLPIATRISELKLRYSHSNGDHRIKHYVIVLGTLHGISHKAWRPKARPLVKPARSPRSTSRHPPLLRYLRRAVTVTLGQYSALHRHLNTLTRVQSAVA